MNIKTKIIEPSLIEAGSHVFALKPRKKNTEKGIKIKTHVALITEPAFSF